MTSLVNIDNAILNIFLKQLPCHINFDSDKVIGEGKNGTKVFLGRYGNQKVAVKRLNPDFYEVYDETEITILKRNPHKNVIRVFAVAGNQDYFFVVYEMCALNIYKYVLSPSHQLRKKISEREVVTQASQGLNHLHEMKIIHEDLRPQNIMMAELNGKLVVKITDFCIKEIEARPYGEEVWLAPEMISSKKSVRLIFFYLK